MRIIFESRQNAARRHNYSLRFLTKTFAEMLQRESVSSFVDLS